MIMRTSVVQRFHHVFGEEPLVVRAPGRVNLIGEHTDYNMGFVLPAAIDRAMFLALSPRTDGKMHAVAVDLNESFETDLPRTSRTGKGWPDYLLGVVDQLTKHRYPVQGFNCVFGGTVPIGAGLSSSAALEVGLVAGLNELFGLGIDRVQQVRYAQASENEFVGVKCGIMDQFISMFGKKDHALRLDCRSLEYSYVPLRHDMAVVLFDSGVKHSLASSEYNVRRSECEQGVRVIQSVHPQVQSLRDVSPEMLREFHGRLDAVVEQRCRYVVEENERLLRGCTLLEQNDLDGFGELMFRTHDGLSKDYGVSCRELDFLVDQVREDDGVYGSRMMGGGFGGCTINLVRPEEVERVTQRISAEYLRTFGTPLRSYVTTISDGATVGQENTVERP